MCLFTMEDQNTCEASYGSGFIYSLKIELVGKRLCAKVVVVVVVVVVGIDDVVVVSFFVVHVIVLVTIFVVAIFVV